MDKSALKTSIKVFKQQYISWIKDHAQDIIWFDDSNNNHISYYGYYKHYKITFSKDKSGCIKLYCYDTKIQLACHIVDDEFPDIIPLFETIKKYYYNEELNEYIFWKHALTSFDNQNNIIKQ